MASDKDPTAPDDEMDTDEAQAAGTDASPGGSDRARPDAPADPAGTGAEAPPPSGDPEPYEGLAADADRSSPDDAVLACHHVSRWYGDVIAVNDIDVTVGPGITGLLGPNGAGKTTLIRMAMGLIRPSQGHLSVLGEDPWNNPRMLGRIGYVPEAPAPWRDRSGIECLRRGALLVGLEGQDADDAAEQALRTVGLGAEADKTVAGYSHGMQQRLKFALALVHDPQMLILDEPLLGTDPLARRDLMQLMRKQAEEGKSVLLSTHVLTDVEVLTQRIMLLDHGRLMAHGAVHDIRDLLDQYPRTVRIGTRDPRALGRRVWDWDTVQSIEAEEGHLTVMTRAPAAFYEELQRFLAESDVEFTSVTSPDDSVEAVFRYLVK